MIYEKSIIVPAQKAGYITKILQHEPENQDDCFGEDETISYTASFENGIEVDVKICGVQYEEGKSNLPWTEAVMFQRGSEVQCSEPESEFFGKWEFKNDDDTYLVYIIAEETRR